MQCDWAAVPCLHVELHAVTNLHAEERSDRLEQIPVLPAFDGRFLEWAEQLEQRAGNRTRLDPPRLECDGPALGRERIMRSFELRLQFGFESGERVIMLAPSAAGAIPPFG